MTEALSKNIQDIVPLADAFMRGMKQAGMAQLANIFPGHGSVKADSHVAAAIDSRSYDEIYDKDIQKFYQVDATVGCKMPAHVIYDQVDPNPAAFSPFGFKTVLRQQLEFDGVLFSDDLKHASRMLQVVLMHAFKAALNAGCDMGWCVMTENSSMYSGLDGIKNWLYQTKLAETHAW